MAAPRMTPTLYPYQNAGARWLSDHTRGYLADEPGLGKTRTVRPHWRREADVVGIATPYVESYQKYVTSQIVRDLFRCMKADVLILDEAHFLKHREAQRTAMLLGPKTGLARTVDRVWPMSGTPMPRHPAELFAVLASLWPQRLVALGIRGYMDFLNMFCVWKDTDYGVKVFGVRNAEKLRTLLEPIMLRRTVQGVLPELPDLRWATLSLDSTPEELRDLGRQLDEWVSLHDREMLEHGEIPHSENFARARHAIGDVKAHVAGKMLVEELAEDLLAKRVVFAHHRSVLDTLEHYCIAAVGGDYVRLDGSTHPTERERAISRFQQDPTCRVFLGQIQACATGITLTAANDVVIVEPAASDVNVQAAKRVHRIGQRKSCLVRMLALADTLDEVLVRNHHRECAMVAAVVGA